ncbi:hypothetical protein PR202_ga04609 [Eleusine coracana subsp. coracana]|uniref:Peptidase A1 domain-containing protein n=1 Tax=Eleusine coracana subsp. coracana TaxID=191504 RepID=A0AAV5BS84_ELECO|nr:hypothetical protein PR202_ga04609 [Eleusine coracana subsp. coracana]
MARLLVPALAALLLFLSLHPACLAAGSGDIINKTTVALLAVSKDKATQQYVSFLWQRTPLVPVKAVLDLAGASLWVDCESGYTSSTYRGVPCGSKPCRLARTAACATSCSAPPSPSCLNDTCGGFPSNTVTRVSTSGNILTDALALPTTFRPAAGPARARAGVPLHLRLHGNNTPPASCSSATRALRVPAWGGRVGVADLHAAARQPGEHGGRVKEKGTKSDEYFVGVTAIKVNGRAVPLNATLLAIDRKTGVGGTKLSTVAPYTVLETSIHAAVTAAFAAETSSAKVPRAPAVAPFALCYDGSKVGSTRVGPAVPTIELVMGSDAASWVVFGANSMVRTAAGALCLGVVDGGKAPRTSVVIGGHMMEDNLLEFDLDRSRLGFSSSLLFRQTNCNNYHLG